MNNYTKYLSIDPSGSGTTGIFFWNKESKEEYFVNFKNKNWKEHFLFLKKFCEEKNPDVIVYETTNFIKIRGSDLTSLFKIFGAIETIPYSMKSIKSCETIFVREVKMLQKKIKDNKNEKKEIENIIFRSGRGGGWFRKEKKIDIHQVDAFIILYLYLKKQNPEIKLY